MHNLTQNRLQLDLRGLFLVTTVAAVAAAFAQTIGLFWCTVVLLGILCIRLPIYGYNPIVQAISYSFAFFLVTIVIACYWAVPPLEALPACCLLPALAYIVGFTNGLREER